MEIIGLTGPTGAGKTTALQVLAGMGFTIVDCDALYYRLLQTDEKLRRSISDAFGDVFLPNGQLDRPKLGALVFSDGAALEKLNAIVADAINRAVDEIIAGCTNRGVVIDAINLVESGLARRCDLTVALTAPKEARLRRIMARDGIDETYARKRMASQKKDSYYKKNCMFLLENRADSPEEFRALIAGFFGSILADDREE